MITRRAVKADPARAMPCIHRLIAPVTLILLCVLFSSMRWLKTESFWGDSSRWIFEAWRVSLGEVPYRDFAWQYPPLSLLLFGAAFRVFGASFLVAQIVIDIISTGIVLLSWRVARLMLPSALAMAVAATLACSGTGNTGNFALFSLQIYTPALLVGMAGFLLLLASIGGRIASASSSSQVVLLSSIGATIALLSKPEFAMGVVGVLAATAIYEARLCFAREAVLVFWLRRQALLFGVTVLPGLAIYALIAWHAGLRNVLAGFSGYGMAYLVCPWWPTGLGLFGVLVALCQAAVLLLFLRQFSPRRPYPLSRRTRIALQTGAVLAIPTTLLYVPYCIQQLPVFAGGATPSATASFFLSAGTVFLPVMWASAALWPALAFRFGFARTLSRESGILLVLITSGLLMSARSLFGGTLSQLTLVTVAAYPIWFIVGPVLIERFLQGWESSLLQHTSTAVLVLVVGYALLRFGSAVTNDRRMHYLALDTTAGQVHLLDRVTSPAVYRYVMDHTSASDRILDVSYGGAVNFAGRRMSPLYSTQFSALAPSQTYMDADLARVRAHPPKLVIANDQPDSGAEYGLCVETGCVFPALVWRSSRLACDPNRKFPALEFVKQNYTPVAQLGKKTLYALKAPQRSAN